MSFTHTSSSTTTNLILLLFSKYFLIVCGFLIVLSGCSTNFLMEETDERE